jgi:hypothetical protein
VEKTYNAFIHEIKSRSHFLGRKNHRWFSILLEARVKKEDWQMKSFKKISIFVVILVAGLLMAGARTPTSHHTLPAAKDALSPGDYIGTFHFDVREITVISTTNNSLTWNVKDNRDMNVDGTVKVNVTGPNEGTILIDPTNYDIYDIRDISATGSGIKCHLTGYMEIKAPITFQTSLKGGYDPQNRTFLGIFWINGWSIQYFRNIVDSTIPACTQQANQKTLEAVVQNFFNQINKNSPMIFRVLENSNNSLMGNIYTENYDKSTDVTGGWTQRKLSGSWYVEKQPVKDSGWKK